jgi:hypothetical protein
MFSTQLVEGFFGQVAKRRMTKIVGERSSLSYVRIQPAEFANGIRLFVVQFFSKTPSKLRYFQRVCQAVMEDVAFIG